MLQAVTAPPVPLLTAPHLARLEALRQRAASIARAVDAYRGPIFARHSFTDHRGEPIATPARVFLARERAKVAAYYAELERAHVAHRLPRRGQGACPATSALLDLRDAEGAAPVPPPVPVRAFAAPALPVVARSPRLAPFPAASGSFSVTVWDSELREGRGGNVVVQIETDGIVTEQERRAARRVTAAALASTYRHEHPPAVRAALRTARQLARAGDPECVAAPLNAAIGGGLLPHELPALTAELRRLYQGALRDRQEIAERVASHA